jgi:hypothetical protein
VADVKIFSSAASSISRIITLDASGNRITTYVNDENNTLNGDIIEVNDIPKTSTEYNKYKAFILYGFHDPQTMKRFAYLRNLDALILKIAIPKKYEYGYEIYGRSTDLDEFIIADPQPSSESQLHAGNYLVKVPVYNEIDTNYVQAISFDRSEIYYVINDSEYVVADPQPTEDTTDFSKYYIIATGPTGINLWDDNIFLTDNNLYYRDLLADTEEARSEFIEVDSLTARDWFNNVRLTNRYKFYYLSRLFNLANYYKESPYFIYELLQDEINDDYQICIAVGHYITLANGEMHLVTKENLKQYKEMYNNDRKSVLASYSYRYEQTDDTVLTMNSISADTIKELACAKGANSSHATSNLKASPKCYKELFEGANSPGVILEFNWDVLKNGFDVIITQSLEGIDNYYVIATYDSNGVPTLVKGNLNALRRDKPELANKIEQAYTNWINKLPNYEVADRGGENIAPPLDLGFKNLYRIQPTTGLTNDGKVINPINFYLERGSYRYITNEDEYDPSIAINNGYYLLSSEVKLAEIKLLSQTETSDVKIIDETAIDSLMTIVLGNASSEYINLAKKLHESSSFTPSEHIDSLVDSVTYLDDSDLLTKNYINNVNSLPNGGVCGDLLLTSTFEKYYLGYTYVSPVSSDSSYDIKIKDY